MVTDKSFQKPQIENKKTSKQTNKIPLLLLCFPRYWKPVCSLGAADKFVGYIHSQHPLMMNHQWYTVVVALYATDFHWTPSCTVEYFPTTSGITVFSIGHHLIHPSIDVSWFGSVKAVLCSAHPANQHLERLLQLTRIQWLTKIDSACSYEAFNSRVPHCKEECLNLSGRIESQRRARLQSFTLKSMGSH